MSRPPRARARTGDENAETSDGMVPVWTWRDAIRRAKVPPLTKLVCYTLSSYLNDVGACCWPSVKRLMEETGLGNKALAAHLKNACDAGLLHIRRERSKDGRMSKNFYHPRFPDNARLPRVDDAPEDDQVSEGHEAKPSVGGTSGPSVFQTSSQVSEGHANLPTSEITQAALLGAHEPVNFALLSHQLTEAAGDALDNPVNCMGLLNLAIPQMWLNSGADLELDILPTLRAASIRHRGKRIRDWKYFSGMISDAMAARKAGMPTAQGPPAPGQRPPTKAEEKIAKTREFNAQMDRYFQGGKS